MNAPQPNPAPPLCVRTLLAGVIDYAGLFPPAQLDMGKATEAFAHARAGEHEWMLSRFVCPATRLAELEKHASALMPGTFATSGYREMEGTGQPWRISALLEPDASGNLDPGLDLIFAFNERHAASESGLAEVDMLEIKLPPSDPARAVDALLDQCPEGMFPFFEFPVTTDCRGVIAALSGSPCGAKIRTGGVVGNAFPTPAEVSAFVRACHHADVPFKATAGLHHAVRGNYRLTYEPGSPSCTMHGFLNLFVAAALVKAHNLSDDEVQQVLTDATPGAFVASEGVLKWRQHLLTTAQIAAARERCSLSFGSCSFDEPVEELRAMRWLRA